MAHHPCWSLVLGDNRRRAWIVGQLISHCHIITDDAILFQIDSFLGATLQISRYSMESKRILKDETPASRDTKIISGINVLTNNQVRYADCPLIAMLNHLTRSIWFHRHWLPLLLHGLGVLWILRIVTNSDILRCKWYRYRDTKSNQRTREDIKDCVTSTKMACAASLPERKESHQPQLTNSPPTRL